MVKIKHIMQHIRIINFQNIEEDTKQNIHIGTAMFCQVGSEVCVNFEVINLKNGFNSKVVIIKNSLLGTF